MGKIKLKRKQLPVTFKTKGRQNGHDDAVVVIGAGSAGIAAAICAARLKKNIFLIETDNRPGGTVVQSLIHTLGGIYDSSGRFINKGLCVELTERLSLASPLTRMRKIGRLWTLSVCPDIYEKTVRSWIREESKIRVFYNSRLTRIVKDGSRISAIEFVSPEEGVITVQTSALIDATGNAAAVYLLNHRLTVNAWRKMAGGLIFRMQGVKSETLKFPKNIELVRAIRRAANEKILPRQCALAWVDIGVGKDEAYVKLTVSLKGNYRGQEDIKKPTQRALELRNKLVLFLKGFPGFSKAKITHTGKLGVRSGNRVTGEYCLTEEDVRGGRKFSDPACRCCWPIEYWNPETGVSLEYLPDNTYYEIPLRSLKVKGIENLWAAGKSFSAETRAQASARVVGSCWSMGEAAGREAVKH